jgi:hypothetical protein
VVVGKFVCYELSQEMFVLSSEMGCVTFRLTAKGKVFKTIVLNRLCILIGLVRLVLF